MKKRIAAVLTAAVAAGITAFAPAEAFAAEKFDPAFYAAVYPEVVAVLGADADVLYNYYIVYGQNEGRVPYADAAGGAAVDGIADTWNTQAAVQAAVPAPVLTGIVPVGQLANYKSIKKNMTDAEFQAAYNEALNIVQPLAGLDPQMQMAGIMGALRARFDSGMVYSTSSPHYNDPYGYLILGSASCAGSTRTTGLCLNMLGYAYEHVNENQWTHQWCRVNLNGAYWICDPYGLYAGPEPAPYQHPMLLMAYSY